MNTAIKHKTLTYRKLIIERLLSFYHLYYQAIFWGLRLLLAFLLLLLSLSPSVSGLAQAICLVGLAILAMICFLDNERHIGLGHTQRPSSVNADETKGSNRQSLPIKNRKTKSVFEPLNIRQIVFEVTAFAEKNNITKKTIELFVLPNAYGTRHATKAIDQLKDAGYAIRLTTDADLPDSVQHHQQNLIGESNGYVHIYISQ